MMCRDRTVGRTVDNGYFEKKKENMAIEGCRPFLWLVLVLCSLPRGSPVDGGTHEALLRASLCGSGVEVPSTGEPKQEATIGSAYQHISNITIPHDRVEGKGLVS